jgi:hypothetical protein
MLHILVDHRIRMIHVRAPRISRAQACEVRSGSGHGEQPDGICVGIFPSKNGLGSAPEHLRGRSRAIRAGRILAGEICIGAKRDGVARVPIFDQRCGPLARDVRDRRPRRRLAGDRRAAIAWYRAQPIPAFGGRTAESLVKTGEARAVRDYLDGLGRGDFCLIV